MIQYNSIRRLIVIGWIAGLPCGPGLAAPGPRTDGLVAHWAFESLEQADNRTVTADRASDRRDEVRGRSRLQEGVRAKAEPLRDGGFEVDLAAFAPAAYRLE